MATLAPNSFAAMPATPAAPVTRAQTVHRPFFIAAILITLTLGATWGAGLLWRIGSAQSFTAVGIHEINAHGEAQLFGWVGLFIMGFAYQVLPRMMRSTIPRRSLALTALAIMLVGLALRTTGMVLHDSWNHAFAMAMIGGAFQLAAIAIFLLQMITVFERRRAPFEPYMGFVLVGLGWFALSSIMSVWYTWLTIGATSRDELLFYVSTYQAALRDAQIHGVALFMILGVSLKILPAMFGLPRIDPKPALAALGMLTIAVAGEVSFFIAFRLTEAVQLAALVYGMWILIALAIAAIILPWRIWRPLALPDGRGDKFIRAAYMWLAISICMLLLLPVYQMISGLSFSHAYYGAVRHAITVGFISMMIMGVGSKVIPALSGAAANSSGILAALWGPFLLVNVGCALRVTMQPLSDATSTIFPFLGVSGVMEVAGLAWWGASMIGLMLPRSIRQRDGAELVQVSIDSASVPGRANCCSCCRI